MIYIELLLVALKNGLAQCRLEFGRDMQKAIPAEMDKNVPVGTGHDPELAPDNSWRHFGFLVCDAHHRQGSS